MHVMLSAERLSFMCLVPWRYRRTCFSLPQLSSPGRLMRVCGRSQTVPCLAILFAEEQELGYRVEEGVSLGFWQEFGLALSSTEKR